MILNLRLHADLDGYALAFVGPDRHETVARFTTLTDAARALRAAQAAAALLAGLEGSARFGA